MADHSRYSHHYPAQLNAPSFLPIDGKYKQYAHHKVSNRDVYQAMLYALAYGPREADSLRHAFLLYPASTLQLLESVIAMRDMHEQRRGNIRVIGIHLPSMFREVRDGVSGAMPQAIMERVNRALE